MGSLPEREVLRPWITTPLIESLALSKAAGCRIFLKLENLQPSGSFKSRGIGNLIQKALLTHAAPETTHFYSSSGGNAGLACVTAAQTLGRPATVVVPTVTKPLMIARIKTAGADEVIQHGDSWREADEYMREVVMPAGRAKGEDAVYVPPFDHEDIWNGHSTLIEELEEKPDAIVCSVGGGGLLCGVQLGLERKGWADTAVLAVETEGAASLRQSCEAGKLVTLDKITTIATCLGAKRVASRALELASRGNACSVVLSDAEAAMGCWRLADDERMIVEPACGVTVALCYEERLKEFIPWLTNRSVVVIVLCGGSDITLETLSEYKKTYGYIEKQVPQIDDIASTVTVPKGQTTNGVSV